MSGGTMKLARLSLLVLAWLPCACDTPPESVGAETCGNGLCAASETCSTCPADCGACPAGCGDGACAAGETCTTCPDDCGACCGDGACASDESCSTCPGDCGECPAQCGDGTCATAESCASCPEDCGHCPSWCGDAWCDRDESCQVCVADCGECPPGCGDGACDPMTGESCVNCPGDCTCGDATCQSVLECARRCAGDGACIGDCVMTGCHEAQGQAEALLACVRGSCASQCVDLGSTSCLICIGTSCSAQGLACYNGVCGPQHCGDATCQPEEDCVSCPGDCGACPDLCGDGTCQPQETCSSCERDCGACCGNGVCGEGEACDTCPDDCGRCPITCGDGVCEALFGETCENCRGDCTCGDTTCSQVLTCIYGCQDVMCPNDCLVAGCPVAQEQARAVLACLLSSCLSSCLNPSDPQCQQCVLASCSAELMTCMLGGC